MSKTDVMSTIASPLSALARAVPGQDTANNTGLPGEWKGYQQIVFRIAFIFFTAISIPNSKAWYQHVVNIDWARLHYRDLYDIARFGSGINFFGNTLFGSSLKGYASWIITLLIAIAGGLVWTIIANRRKKPPTEYNLLYYWLRVIVRYRAGIGIIGFGFTKLLPVQMPYPSWGLLNTNFGDFTAQKIYWLSIGIVPWYQVFAGVVEIAAGAMLLFRKTTTLGAALLVGALGDIVFVNFAYDGGVHVYSSYFVLLGGFLLVQDIPRLYHLLILERYTVPVYYFPVFTKKWQRYARIGLKTAVILVFLVLLFYLQLINFLYDPYKQPATPGVHKLRGNYRVSEFRINGRLLPYDPLDSVRWQQVTFEKWTSLTFRVNRPTMIDLSNGGGDPMRDIDRTFELTGTGGGYRVFHYYTDTVAQVLYLQDKYKPAPDRRNRVAGQPGAVQQAAPAQDNRGGDWIPPAALARIGDENTRIDKRAASTRRDREFATAPPPGKEQRKRMILHYETTNGDHVILKGINEKQDLIYMVLDRINRKYALPGSDLEAGKY